MPTIERLAWTAAAWGDYLHRQSPAYLSNPFDGIGKPEPLRETVPCS
jgi:Txe/YoeB family toxin of Txe-Axe toxin-antitoxin module